MKARLFTAAIALASTLPALAVAEVPGEYYYNYRRASTPLGDLFQGGSEVIRSTGEAVRNGSIAAINLERARSQYMRNNYEATKLFWERRLLAKEMSAQMRGQPLTSEQIRQMARDAAPDRLSSLQLSPTSGQIQWPEALLRPEYDTFRAELDKIFANRTVANSGVGSSSETAIARLTKEMRRDLKTKINEMPINEYMVAKNFLRSLAYEARFLPGLEGVAQR